MRPDRVRGTSAVAVHIVAACLIRASKPPSTPYPPDVDHEIPPGRIHFGSLADVAAADLDWAGVRELGFSAHRVELRRCRLTGADLAEATLRDVSVDECRIDLLGLRHATLERVVFRDCRMSECDLYGATLKDVLFERCDLREATAFGVRASNASTSEPATARRSSRRRGAPGCAPPVERRAAERCLVRVSARNRHARR